MGYVFAILGLMMCTFDCWEVGIPMILFGTLLSLTDDDK